tara:strand:+ start:1074 stop:1217 length:144 start_codon:yes stop_codon:yes gene_type:complete
MPNKKAKDKKRKRIRKNEELKKSGRTKKQVKKINKKRGVHSRKTNSY